jgi:NAD(P)H-dependent FMN reductase
MSTRLHIAIVSGSHRRASQSCKVAGFLKRQFLATGERRLATVIDLAATPVPLRDETDSDTADAWQSAWRPISQSLNEADGVVLVTPEWEGMATPAIKNLLLSCTASELRHKPVLLVAVSSTDGGAYPIAELRMNSAKNTRACYIPEHLIVKRAKEVFNDFDTAENEEDALLRRRASYALAVLAEYAVALRPLRTGPLSDARSFPYGM